MYSVAYQRELFASCLDRRDLIRNPALRIPWFDNFLAKGFTISSLNQGDGGPSGIPQVYSVAYQRELMASGSDTAGC
jgi:hypothetical protein